MTATRQHRRSRAALLSLVLDRDSREPLQRQLYGQVREAVLNGRLAPGVRLPSSRALAVELGCSRNTVVGAFERLLAEGYLESRSGSGTAVARVLPETLLSRGPAAPVAPAEPGRRGRAGAVNRRAGTPSLRRIP